MYEPQAGKSGAYVCLSHCWGKRQIITLTTDTLERYKKGIEWSALSKTFQDALTFAWRMGIQYVWIDSLCIIQNNDHDWETEATKMASYYMNGHFTIAATASSNSSGGLFHHLAPEELSIHFEATDPRFGSPYSIGARRSLSHHLDILDVMNGATEGFPLLARGWVYQERILSRRVLHFGPREVHWECHEDTACQCGGIKTAFELNPSGKDGANQLLNIMGTLRTNDRALTWSRHIQNVTKLEFTYISDQLPALAGVATLLQRSGESSRYLAGLWEEGLPYWLSWTTHEKGSRPKSLQHIPSWSWASVSGEITYKFLADYFNIGPWGQRGHGFMLLVQAAQVINVQCSPDPPPISGRLDVGKLTLTGDAVHATIHCMEDTEGQPEFRFGLDGEPSVPPQSQWQWPFQCDSYDSDTATDLHGQRATIFHLLSYEAVAAQIDGPSWKRSFLVVVPLAQQPGRYRRVGILQTGFGNYFAPSELWTRMEKDCGVMEGHIGAVFLSAFKKAAAREVVQLL
jgi:hypothetical protein